MSVCRSGHELTPESTYHPVARPTVTVCRLCRRARDERNRDAKEPMMTATEVIAEVDWFLSFRVHPENIALELGRSPIALAAIGYKYGRPDLGRMFEASRKTAIRKKVAA